MSKEKSKEKKPGFDAGHFKSQKFAGMVFCVFLLFTAGFFLPLAAFGNLVMGVTALYTAFVGGRAWSDTQSLKYSGGSSADVDGSRVRRGINQGPAANVNVNGPLNVTGPINDLEID